MDFQEAIKLWIFKKKPNELLIREQSIDKGAIDEAMDSASNR